MNDFIERMVPFLITLTRCPNSEIANTTKTHTYKNNVYKYLYSMLYTTNEKEQIMTTEIEK